MSDDNDAEVALARALIDDARRDRDLLRQRWQTPRWRDDVLQIATALERNPSLIQVVEACIVGQLATSPDQISGTPGAEYPVPSTQLPPS